MLIGFVVEQDNGKTELEGDAALADDRIKISNFKVYTAVYGDWIDVTSAISNKTYELLYTQFEREALAALGSML